MWVFWGFLRAGEFTIPSSNAYDPEVHLSLADVALDSHTAPSMVRLRIKQSKTDPFRVGVDVFLGATHTEICPVRALIQFLAVRSPDPSPLFLTHTGTPLTRAVLVKELQSALEKVAYLRHSTMDTVSGSGQPRQRLSVALKIHGSKLWGGGKAGPTERTSGSRVRSWQQHRRPCSVGPTSSVGAQTAP